MFKIIHDNRMLQSVPSIVCRKEPSMSNIAYELFASRLKESMNQQQ